VATPIKIDGAFHDPVAIRALVERNGPYRSIASYLPPSATVGGGGDGEPEGALPWFRSNWAVNGRSLVEGADVILNNPRFIDAASRLFSMTDVRPTTVVVNVNAPMVAGAVHVDIPSFRGANRDRYPLRLLQAMGASGLFEKWRVVEAGAISWFYEGPGGAYDYWPEGLDGAMHSVRPPFDNVALVADNDRMYHRIGWVGDPAAPSVAMSAGAEICRQDSGEWAITDAGASLARYPGEQIRISVLWKAQVRPGAATDDGVSSLTPHRVVEIVTADLRERGIDAAVPVSPLSDERWLNLVHATYYPSITVNG
jgi:hypothetical protein